MTITPLKTAKVTANKYTLETFLDEHIHDFEENTVLVVTSKVVSLCEGNIVSPNSIALDELLEKEADFFLPRSTNPYGFGMSIKNNTLIANGGIDESNGNGSYILWPKDPQLSANTIREYLCKRFSLSKVGVIISDSHVLPMRWGTVGTAIAFSGFVPLNEYIGTNDLFGRPFKVTRSGVAEGLAAAAVVAMGEGSESTPLAILSGVSFVQFQDRNPTNEELEKHTISLTEDIFAPLLTAVPWKKGKSS